MTTPRTLPQMQTTVSTLSSALLRDAPTRSLSSRHQLSTLEFPTTGMPILNSPLVSSPSLVERQYSASFHEMPQLEFSIDSSESVESSSPPVSQVNLTQPQETPAQTSVVLNSFDLETLTRINLLEQQIAELKCQLELSRGSVVGSGAFSQAQTTNQLDATSPPIPVSRSPRSGFSLTSWKKSTPSQEPTASDLTIITHHELFKPPLSKETIKDTIRFTAMSANGQKLAITGERRFRIFTTNPVSCICTGDFTNKGKNFQYPHPGKGI